jgi:hypothetical protein
MRERFMTFLLALGALAAFFGLILRPAPALDTAAEVARPTTAERRGNGFAGAYEWLQASGIAARSLRERYTELATLDIPARGNLLVLALPSRDGFRSDELAPLDRWLRQGNTLLLTVALNDSPSWSEYRGAIADLETLTGLEFETPRARAQRLDDTPPAERVRQLDAKSLEDEQGDDDEDDAKSQKQAREAAAKEAGVTRTPDNDGRYIPPLVRTWKAVGSHALLAGVTRISTESDSEVAEFALRVPFDNFLLTLARDSATDEGRVFEQRLGAGRVLLLSGGSPFTNRVLGKEDNARFFANIVAASVAPGGAVLFDDLRQGLAASYDPARFYEDRRLHYTLGLLLALWLIWVLSSTRLRAPAIVVHDPSEAELVRAAGGLITRTVPVHTQALALFDQFFLGVARAARGPGTRQVERGELWTWLERHAAILPQELDQIKTWYAEAHAARRVPLVPLQNLLDQLKARIKT